MSLCTEPYFAAIGWSTRLPTIRVPSQRSGWRMPSPSAVLRKFRSLLATAGRHSATSTPPSPLRLHQYCLRLVVSSTRKTGWAAERGATFFKQVLTPSHITFPFRNTTFRCNRALLPTKTPSITLSVLTTNSVTHSNSHLLPLPGTRTLLRLCVATIISL